MQSKAHYLLIGNGRVSRHFQHYFDIQKISYDVWHRNDDLDLLHAKSKEASHILTLISDQNIEDFIQTHLLNYSAIRIHFSGSLISNLAYGAHPLMTFNNQLYDLKKYQSIPFILDEDAPAFSELLPGLSNSHVRLSKSLKAKYHALCVLSGNFSCLLWQKFFSSLESEFNLPSVIGQAYLLQQTENILTDYKSALTGPLLRQDENTIEQNIAALEKDPFQEIYQSFVSCYAKIKEESSI